MSSPEDFTARARIRDAALELFAERGIAGATVRDIALKAGVSSGLLRHHFGSKEGLRDACDEYAMARLNELRAKMLAGQSFVGSLDPVAMQLQAYLVRSMADGSTPQLFALMLQAGDHWMTSENIASEDPKVFVGVLVAMQMGIFLMRPQLSRALGFDTTAPAGHARLLAAAVEIFEQVLITPAQAEQARAALAAFTPGEDDVP